VIVVDVKEVVAVDERELVPEVVVVAVEVQLVVPVVVGEVDAVDVGDVVGVVIWQLANVPCVKALSAALRGTIESPQALLPSLLARNPPTWHSSLLLCFPRVYSDTIFSKFASIASPLQSVLSTSKDTPSNETHLRVPLVPVHALMTAFKFFACVSHSVAEATRT